MKCRSALCLVVMFSILACLVAIASANPIIRADKTYFDVNTGLHVLNGHVNIEVRDRIITAGQAKISLSSLEVWGSGGITLTQGDIYLVADSVYVIGAQNKALIEGNITFKRSNLAVIADKAEFDWKTKLGVFSGNVQVTQSGNTWRGASATYNFVTEELSPGL